MRLHASYVKEKRGFGESCFVRNDGNNAIRFHASCVEEKSGFGKSCFVRNDGVAAASNNFGFRSVNNYDEVSILHVTSRSSDVVGQGGGGGRGDELAPHSALSFSLGYLGLSDLLVVERVCKSLHSMVRGDSLLWRSVHGDTLAFEIIFVL
ncbi:hypothetical protein JHK87_001056 [Glycine soja]|nr:hypothetical protein JHK87_001056 [Glycine soja]